MGVVLVGGASRRFGSPKALARFRGRSLAEHAWCLVGETFGSRFAVGKVSDLLELPFPIVDDGTEIRAPLAGVVAGLRAAPHDLCVFVPVDVPLLTPTALRALADGCRDAAVPATGPLPGAYRRRALTVLEHRLAVGELALHEALDELDVAIVPIDESLLANVNERADLERIGRIL